MPMFKHKNPTNTQVYQLCLSFFCFFILLFSFFNYNHLFLFYFFLKFKSRRMVATAITPVPLASANDLCSVKLHFPFILLLSTFMSYQALIVVYLPVTRIGNQTLIASGYVIYDILYQFT